MIERLFGLLEKTVNGQQKLAQHLGISPKSVSSWKARGAWPPAKYIPQIAEYLGVSIDWLMTGKEYAGSNVVNAPVTGIAFMQGANHGTLNVRNGTACALSAEAVELVRIFETLEYKQRRAVMDMVADMGNGGK